MKTIKLYSARVHTGPMCFDLTERLLEALACSGVEGSPSISSLYKGSESVSASFAGGAVAAIRYGEWTYLTCTASCPFNETFFIEAFAAGAEYHECLVNMKNFSVSSTDDEPPNKDEEAVALLGEVSHE